MDTPAGSVRHFLLELERHATVEATTPSNVDCSSNGKAAEEVNCRVQHFAGILHVSVAGGDSYFNIPKATDVHIETPCPTLTLNCDPE